MATTPERREAGSKSDIENVLLKANDDDYRWPDGGGSRSTSSIIARCNMEDGEMNETGTLDDGDDLVRRWRSHLDFGYGVFFAIFSPPSMIP